MMFPVLHSANDRTCSQLIHPEAQASSWWKMRAILNLPYSTTMREIVRGLLNEVIRILTIHSLNLCPYPKSE